MTLLNDIEDYAAKHDAAASAAFAEALRSLLLISAPFAPHITEELWDRTGGSGSIHAQPWPNYVESALKRAQIGIVIQVNGKRRGLADELPGVDEKTVFEHAKHIDTVAAQLNGKTVRKLVFVKDKLLNIVAD
jgi:leucyl-tRNA synthetase